MLLDQMYKLLFLSVLNVFFPRQLSLPSLKMHPNLNFQIWLYARIFCCTRLRGELNYIFINH